ncbi:RND family transporter [Anatilimnocola sp. NA78]|uniref:efflux RND transporter permease subunit n=1 Tax=Anatilimnocola sp. NA78 TaxID=3415683 RepID=UPI003CE56EA0
MSPSTGSSQPNSSFASRLVDLYLRGRWIWLAIAIVIAAIAYPAAQRVKFDRSVERMFASDDPLLPPFERLKRQFGGNEVVLAVYPDDGLFNPDGSGLKRVADVRARLEKVDGVLDVLSLAEINSLVEQIGAAQNLGGIFNLGSKPKWKGPPLLDPNSKVAANFLHLFEGYTHGPDHKTAAFACMLEPPKPGELLDAQRRDRTIKALREVVQDLPNNLKGGVLAGEPVMVVEGFNMLEKDGRRLWLWSTIMLAVTVVVCFFSFRWLLAPLAVVNWALLLTQATLVWSQLELTMVSSMLSAIITVVGVASVVHLIVRCRELEAEGIHPYNAFRTSILALAIPIAGAIATDVGGFGSLWSAKVGPVQDFGTMMFIGSLMVIPAISLLLPAISLLGIRSPTSSNESVAVSSSAAHTSWIDKRLHDGLTWLLRTIRGRQGAVGIVLALVSVFIAFGVSRLDVETDFTRNFRLDSQVVKSYEFVETRLGGAGVWDVIIPAPRELNEAYLDRVRKLQARLRAIEFPAVDKQPARPGLTKVISYVDALDAIKVEGVLAAVPLTIEFKSAKMAEELPVFTAALRSLPADKEQPSHLRIMLRARERQSAEQKRWLIEQVRTIALEEFPLTQASDPTTGAEVTGFFVLLTSLIESMLRDQWMTFAVATAAMGFIMLVLFRSLKLALIGIVPNAVPILLVMGLLGWSGLRINMGAAMIAAVSMGLSVDSSIHYLDTFLHATRRGLSVDAALTEVQSSVGRAMLFTTLTLDLGFLVLCTSEFIPTVYFGALVSLAMIGGLAGNLIILPLLLGWFVKDRPA